MFGIGRRKMSDLATWNDPMQRYQREQYQSGALQQPFPQPEQRSGGFFGQGGAGRDIAGAIGDFLLQNAGAAPIFAPAQRQRQAAQLAEREYQRRRADSIEDWKAQQDYKRNNPDLTNFQEELRAAGIDPRSPQAQQLIQQKIQNTVDPEIVAPFPQGTYIGPRSQLSTIFGGGPPPEAPKVQPNEAAANYLKANPNLADQFDQKYGPGSAARILGTGGAGPGQRGFPFPY